MDTAAVAETTQSISPIVIAIIGFLGVVVGAFVTGILQRKKNNAEADKSTAEANEQIRKTVMSLIQPLENKVNDLERELQDWKNWALALVQQIKKMGCEPVPFKSHKEKEG
jgi:type II secretory pathway pseudopilin PulG